MAKLEILTPAEQIIFNSPPNFSPDEQNKYFCLPPELAVWMKSVDSFTNKAQFILLFGYCRAKRDSINQDSFMDLISRSYATNTALTVMRCS